MREVDVSTVSEPVAHRFRLEIQGLRAVAVGLVLIFHIFPTWATGGYIGVDVFFVISGYLITGILVREVVKTGRLDFLNFYERRARRLLPAASLTIVATCVSGLLFLPESRWENIGKEAIASTLYYQNFFLYFQSLDYLAADHVPSPFQHYWSLSIEEQFYLVWPMIMILGAVIARYVSMSFKTTLVAFLVVVISVSFSASLIHTPSDPGAYFLSSTRIWELGIGSIIAVCASCFLVPATVGTWLRCAGLLMILAAGFGFDTATPFPGYAALLPVLGAAFIVYPISGEMTRLDPARLLMIRPMQYLGDISYSLYLWHWPVVVVGASILGNDYGFGIGVSLLVTSIALSHFSKIYVEDRFRNRPEGTTRRRSFFMATAMLALALAAALGVRAPAMFDATFVVEVDDTYPGAAIFFGFEAPLKSAPFLPPLTVALKDNPAIYADGCHVAQSDIEPTPCWYGPEDADKVIVITGDSHAGHWVPALRKITEINNWALVTHTKSSCPFIRGNVWRRGEIYEACVLWNAKAMESIISLKPDLVVTAKISNSRIQMPDGTVNSRSAVVDGLADAWTQLGDHGIPVLAIGQTPRFDFEIPDCLGRYKNPEECSRTRNDVLSDFDPIPLAVNGTSNAVFLDMNEYLCQENICPPIIGNVLVYRDFHHLTATYSRTLAIAIVQPVMSAMGERTVEIGLTRGESGQPKK